MMKMMMMVLVLMIIMMKILFLGKRNLKFVSMTKILSWLGKTLKKLVIEPSTPRFKFCLLQTWLQ